MVFIMIYLFAFHDALTSEILTTRTERLITCCEALQKRKVRLWPYKTGISSLLQVFYYWSFQDDTSVVVIIVLWFGVDFLCCLHLMHVFVYLVKFG